MAKTQKETKEPKESKEPKQKDGKALVRRVKKAVKKSRRKLSEEKFEKELQRTIAFLEALQQKINHAPQSQPEATAEPAPAEIIGSITIAAKPKPSARPRIKTQRASKKRAAASKAAAGK